MKSTYILFPERGRVTVETEEIKTSDLGPAEVIVQNEASIISSGTELAGLQGFEKDATWPFRPGYGSIGRVLAKGTGVDDFKEGDRVFYAGKHALIQRFTHQQNHQWGRLYPVPEGLDPVEAAFGCMAVISMTAPDVTELDLGDTVAVFGLGIVGNLAAQLYKIAGARVLCLDPVAARCALARKVGFEEVIEVPSAQQVQEVRRLTEGRGADVTVDAAGHSAVIETCVESTRLHGQIILLGAPRQSYKGDLTPAYHTIFEKGLVMRGAHQWRYEAVHLRNVKKTVPWILETVFKLIQGKKLRVRELVSHLVGPADVPDVYRGLLEEKDKYFTAVIDWRKS